MSSSATIDWRALREQERREVLQYRAQLAQLAKRRQQLVGRQEIAAATQGRRLVMIPAIRALPAGASPAQIRTLLERTQQELSVAARSLDRAIQSVVAAPQAAAIADWRPHTDDAAVGAPESPSVIDVSTLTPTDDLTRDVAEAAAARDAAALEVIRNRADAVLAECAIRCPGVALTPLIELRDTLGDGTAADQVVLKRLQLRAAQLIQQVKREDALEEEREGLLALAEGAMPQERSLLRRRVADAPLEGLNDLRFEVETAVDRAGRIRSRQEAVDALRESLHGLGYAVGEGFTSLLAQDPDPLPGAQGPVVVVPSKHSDEHGLRVRMGADQIFVAVVRKAGTGEAAPAGAGPGAANRPTDVDVQARTCVDLDAVARAASSTGMQLLVGNRRQPGTPAPELPSQLWVGAQAQFEREDIEREDAERAEAEHRREWEAQEAARRAAQTQQTQRRSP